MTNFVAGFTKRNLKILNNFEKLEVWKLMVLLRES